jgi:hypothetical protein
MESITISDFLSLSPVLFPVDICIVQLFASSPYPEVRKSRIGIAKSLNIGDSTVYRSVKRLEALALLSVQRFPGGSEVNRYKLNTERLIQLIQDMGDFAALEQKEKESFVSEWLRARGYLDKEEKLNLFRLVCDYPSFQVFSQALGSSPLSVPAKPPAIPSGLHDSGEPAEPPIDPQYLILSEQVRDGQVKPALLDWLKNTRMILPSGELDLRRLTQTFPNFRDFCSGYEQQVTEDKNIKNETCSIIDGLNVVQFPAKKQDSTADLIKDLAKHFDSKGV